MDAANPQSLIDRLTDKSLLKEECYVDGEWVGAAQTFPVTDPASGETIAKVPKLGRSDVAKAIAAADQAMPAWAAKSAKERAKILRKWFDLMMENQEDLAQIMTAEQGKPLAESRGEIAYGAAFIEFFAEEGKRVYGETIPSPWPTSRIVVIRQPVGVVAAITPWNFPNAMITRKAGPALAAGCTIVIKPASETPLSALALGELATRAGIPAGVINIVTGSASEIGAELTESPTVRMLTFTGSTEVGKILMEQCARTVKKVGMELGGNAPFIVFDDADLDAAVAGAMASKYRNAGQTCVCANRILVQDKVYDAFAEKFAAAISKMKVGYGTEDGITIGPLINAAAIKKVKEHIEDAVSKGAKIEVGGKLHDLGGNFFQPTLAARRHHRHGGDARGDLRAGGAAVPLLHRGGGDRHGQRHRVRAGLLLLCPRHRPHLAGGRGSRIRHRRHQRGHHLHRDGALRRRQGIRRRPRRLAPRHG
jgi:succinate-semialdehyde dehydrogenase / glutarate-semialdehyde dehydrogenase